MSEPVFLTEEVLALVLASVPVSVPASVPASPAESNRESKAEANLIDRPRTACQCSVGSCLAWESLPQERWPQDSMAKIGTLRDPAIAEPTFEQLHHVVEGRLTHYDSAQAPIAAKYFPFNRCDVFKCNQCTRVLLKYTEFGGYFVDQRVRWARFDLVPAPQNP